MERIVTAAQVRQRDREVIASGVSSLALMRTAAEGLVSAVKACAKTGSVTAISGTGNNGGDGIAAAWLLKREASTRGSFFPATKKLHARCGILSRRGQRRTVFRLCGVGAEGT